MSEAAESAVEIKFTDAPRFGRDGIRESQAHSGPSSADSVATSDAVRNFRVALVTMPFGSSFRPSIQLGLLKPIVSRAGFPVDDHYLNLDLSVQLGFLLCEELQNDMNTGFTGDWLFSVAAFGEEASRADYFEAFPEEAKRIAEATGKDVAFLNDLRDRVMPEFIDSRLDAIDWGAYGAIGFSSTFQQNVASLAIARRIKERHPRVAIIFGGTNMDGEMGVEYVRAFHCIDFAVSGEGDEVFPELLTRLAEGRDTDDMLGVVSRKGDCISFIGPAAAVRDLDNLPPPDYDTYYEVAARYGVSKNEEYLAIQGAQLALRAMPIQGARGCWWGEKAHCTFCGFNRSTMHFRSKSPERMLAEIDALSKKYDRKVIWGCEAIMDMKYIDGLFGPLEDRNDGYEFFFYTKSNLTREQIRRLARGGMKLMFPGIESLSSHVLKLMRKGVTKLQNVNLLKWATYYGVDVGYFLLHGFPGETREDFIDELATCRLINHLFAPMGTFRLRIDRFSPNFWDKDLFPVKWQRPSRAYNFIYPPHVNLEEAAYFFEYESAADVVPEEEHDPCKEAVSQWMIEWFHSGRMTLTYRRSETDILIDDTRLGQDRARSFTLLGLDADIYEAFSAPRTPAQVCAALYSERLGPQPDAAEVTEACDALCEAGLMIGESGKYLSLALPADPEF